ncbi:HPr family phosphocarrier protein [Ectobacillus funiculus]|uniref:HPr family phosphocarrier protein n=1 Tax=Ectobacillus funiculus TaxID=137993 RepID=UPI003979E320
MVERTFIVQLQHGLQARIATQFVQKASSFNSDINLMKNGRSINVKSIMGIMALAIRRGEEVTLFADGNDEQQAAIDLEKFLLNQE